MSKIENLWNDVRNISSIVDVIETCVDFGLNLADTKKVASRWQRNNRGTSGVIF